MRMVLWTYTSRVERDARCTIALIRTLGLVRRTETNTSALCVISERMRLWGPSRTALLWPGTQSVVSLDLSGDAGSHDPPSSPSLSVRESGQGWLAVLASRRRRCTGLFLFMRSARLESSWE